MTYAPKTRVFVSFDYDHDVQLKNLFIGQGKHPDTPFEITDMSVKQALLGDWKEKVRQRIRRVEQVAIVCGEHMRSAAGVAAELQIAREEGKPYFFLKGYSNKSCSFPAGAKSTDKMYTWTWPYVSLLLRGNR